MDLKKTIKNIVYLPSKFYCESNRSTISLLKDTGYFEVPDQIDKANIKELLQLHDECVNDWIILSESKRTDSGWYIIGKDNKYIVGYRSKRENSISSEYDDIFEACAEFIKQEIEDLRKIALKSQ